MRVIKSNMVVINVFMFEMHTFKIFQKLNQLIVYEHILIQRNIIYHTNTYRLMSTQGNVFHKQAWRHLVFMYFFISYHKKILYARN